MKRIPIEQQARRTVHGRMEILEDIAEMQAFSRLRRTTYGLGFVPTMGALHRGHGALIERARAENETVVVSSFVNPMQFDKADDLERYPRDFKGDVDFCIQMGVTALFHPSVEALYPAPFRTAVRVHGLTRHLCGAKRPGHFEGVATIVSKLFHIVQPDRAYFGEKDAQQLAIIKRMTQDLNFPVEIIGVPTLREADGLAMSSRNALLSPAARKAARVLNETLCLAKTALKEGETDLKKLQRRIEQGIEGEPMSTIDYVEIADAQSLEPTTVAEGTVLVAVAVYFGRVRLIDNFSHTFAGQHGN